MGFADFFLACQIGQCTGDAHDAVEASSGKGQFFEHGSQGFLRFFLDAGFAIELADTQSALTLPCRPYWILRAAVTRSNTVALDSPSFLLHQLGSGKAGYFDG